MKHQIIAQGAEAIIYKIGNKIVKDRIKKSYRIKELDDKLRKSRTRSEAKIMSKLQNIIPIPKIIKTAALSKSKDFEPHYERQEIIMEFIEGKKLSESLENLDYKKISEIIGETIAKVHNQNIIHGDLTTSNMIYKKGENHKLNNESENITVQNIINNKLSAKQSSKRRLLSNINQNNKNNYAKSEDKLYFIDFGLSFHSERIEDKAVDLHLIQQALEAKHFTIWKECFNIILKNYEKTSKEGKQILERIKTIESRGRYKNKY